MDCLLGAPMNRLRSLALALLASSTCGGGVTNDVPLTSGVLSQVYSSVNLTSVTASFEGLEVPLSKLWAAVEELRLEGE